MIFIFMYFLFLFFGLNSGVLAQSTCPHGWLKNDNSCYLFVTHVDNDWTESEVQCTISMPCPNDKHTGIISGVFRNSKKVYATHSENFFFQYFCHMIGSKLVEIETEKENNFLKNHARSEHQHGTALKLPERFVF